MKYLHVLLTTLLIGMVLSCHTTTSLENPKYVVPDYRGQKIVSKTLVIVPFATDIVKSKEARHLARKFRTRQSQETFRRMWVHQFPGALKLRSTFDEVQFATFKNKPFLKEQTFEIDPQNTITIEVPASGDKMSFEDVQADFVLFMQNIQIASTQAYNEAGRPTDLYLVYTANYYIWDNREGKLVSYGLIDVWQRADKRRQLIASIDDIATGILKNGPFEKPMSPKNTGKS